ncbi:MAG: hypothetical protein HY673_13855 [Chloroflexi bacterium]|nr:hypothetical protein [Chloroflexota bacterium]
MQTPQEASIPQQQLGSVRDNLKLENRFKGGASWFYWIAGLSMLNTLFVIIGAGWTFFIGLGITQVVDTKLQLPCNCFCNHAVWPGLKIAL